MIYPDNFEIKIGFNEIRTHLKSFCLGTLGKENVDNMAYSDDASVVTEWLCQTREFRRLQECADDFPLQYFFDMREAVSRVRIEGTHLEEPELFDLRRSLNTIACIVRYLNGSDGDGNYDYPALHRVTEDIRVFPELVVRIDQIVDKFGKIKDTASPALADIRRELSRAEGSVSRTLYNILHAAQSEGLIDKDVTPTMRDGRLVVPVAPGMKRRIKGIVHDESSSGKTVFVEPAEVVEANNRIRELEAEERREIIRILTDFTNTIRPFAKDIVTSYRLLADVDFIRAKAEFAKLVNGIEPDIADGPVVDWICARHPLLWLSLGKQGKKVVPLDIMLTPDSRILIISGPNAGGKSVCLKTVGLLQYMLQCGLSVPVGERSHMGVFKNIMIDIGDEQSIENDLSTYSSHLLNMKNMMQRANDRTLLLIDEFGTGTEPQIGGAIAEAVLNQFVKKSSYGVITTHYQNLKHYADSHPGIANGAMLYDRQGMKPLFQLAIGQPGSSFAVEIARKTGLPEEVIREASDIVGSDYIQSDKYLQDIVRDKRYWERKRQNIHQREKDLENIVEKYEADIKELAQKRKEIIRQAKEQAEELLRESNKNIENTIREIRECQAQKEETKRLREELNAFKADVGEIDTKSTDELIEKKMRQIMERKERREKRKHEKKTSAALKPSVQPSVQPKAEADKMPFNTGDTVRMKGLTSVGTVEKVDGKTVTVVFGGIRTKVATSRLEHTEKPVATAAQQAFAVSRETRSVIDNRKLNFRQDLDVRGMRGDEALNAVTHFIDDAILVGMPRVRILHGKGNGILRNLIRQYLSTVPNVISCKDEHVQFGGAGITVVDF